MVMVATHAVLRNRLAAENHSLKRNMGVYIAEAQRAKRTLQHSRAAEAAHMAHDQHDVSSRFPQPPLLSQQNEQQEPTEHLQLNQSSASWITPRHSHSLEQQAQGCESSAQQRRPEFSNTTAQQYDSAEEDSSPGDEFELMSQHEGGFGHHRTGLTPAAQVPNKSVAGTVMDDAKRSGTAAISALAAAEASFALPSFNGNSHKPSALQFSQPQCSIDEKATRHSHAQTDEQSRSHVRQTLHHWYESHQEEEHCGRAQQQSGSCETAEHGGMCDHAATVSDARYRKDASPVAAKFAFARYASTEADWNTCCNFAEL